MDWSDDDVFHFITSKGVKCHPLYYDDCGEFHVERHLGCMCCPLQSRKKRIAEFMKFPKFVKFCCDNGKKWLELHPNIDTKGMDIYEKFVMTPLRTLNLPRLECSGKLTARRFLKDISELHFKKKSLKNICILKISLFLRCFSD